jgi:protein-L-isoaspartate(D-aspartate) O-methyltransferase
LVKQTGFFVKLIIYVSAIPRYNVIVMNAQDTRVIRLIMHLRSAGISDTKVLSAIERVPRDKFIPEQMNDQAYEDIAVPIGRGQTISQPFVVASMTQALELTDRDKVLEIGTGSGYQACVLAHLCRRVYSIERHKYLLDRAEEVFKELGINNVTAIVGDGMLGWPDNRNGSQAPFDKIIITAAAFKEVPQPLMDQLKVGGILVAPVQNINGAQMLKRYKKESEDTFSVQNLLPVRFVPLLPDVASSEEDADDDLNLMSGNYI